MLDNKISKDIEETIQELKEEIQEKQNQINMLTQYFQITDKTITEKQYHEYCKTNMRYTDTLGQSLISVFPFLSYDKRNANAFCYKLDKYQIRIPNSFCVGIEIVADVVFKPTNFVDFNIYELPEIKRYIEYFNTKSIKEKVCFLYPTCHNTLVGIIRYLIENVYMHYDKRTKKQFDDCVATTKEFQKRNKIKAEYFQQLYLEQQDFFEKYISLFLQWTNEVRVYAKGREKPIIIFTLSDGKVVKTIKW